MAGTQLCAVSQRAAFLWVSPFTLSTLQHFHLSLLIVRSSEDGEGVYDVSPSTAFPLPLSKASASFYFGIFNILESPVLLNFPCLGGFDCPRLLTALNLDPSTSLQPTCNTEGIQSHGFLKNHMIFLFMVLFCPTCMLLCTLGSTHSCVLPWQCSNREGLAKWSCPASPANRQPVLLFSSIKCFYSST